MEQEKGLEMEDQQETESTEEEQVVEEVEAEVVNAEESALEKELHDIKEEKDKIYDRLLRLQAEFDNYKKRTEKERVSERKYRVQELATELLPVMDNFQRALETDISEENKGFFEGIEMVYEQLKQALISQEIEAIESLDQEFDPTFHHAVMQIEDENYAPNTVVEELQTGYKLKDRVIRPAMVKVNK